MSKYQDVETSNPLWTWSNGECGWFVDAFERSKRWRNADDVSFSASIEEVFDHLVEYLRFFHVNRMGASRNDREACARNIAP